MHHPAGVRRIPRVLLVVLLAAAPVAAWAGGADVRIEGDRVVVDLEVSASFDATRAVVVDPWAIAGLYGDGTTVTRVEQGDCDTLRYEVGSIVGDVSYTVAFCVEADGARATLTDPPGDMKAYEAVWKVEAAGEGTRIHYELLVVPTMKLPRRVIRSSTKRSVKKLFVRLEQELGG